MATTPSVYQFKYKPTGASNANGFLLGPDTSHYYIWNGLDYTDAKISLKPGQSFEVDTKTLTLTSSSAMSFTSSSTMGLTSTGAMGLTSSGTVSLTASSTMTLSAEKVQASTNKLGTKFSFTSTASTSDYVWVGAAEFGKSQDARVTLGGVYNTTTKQYEPWVGGIDSSETMTDLYIVPGTNSYVYLGNPSSSKGAIARVGSSKLEINRGTTAANWKEVAVKDDIPTASYKYHLTTLWIDVDTAFELQYSTGSTSAYSCGYSKIMIMPAHSFLDFEPNHGGIDSLQQIITNSHLQYGSLCYLVKGNNHIIGVITNHSNGKIQYALSTTYGEVEGVSFTITTAAGSSVSILAQDIVDRKYQKIRIN